MELELTGAGFHTLLTDFQEALCKTTKEVYDRQGDETKTVVVPDSERTLHLSIRPGSDGKFIVNVSNADLDSVNKLNARTSSVSKYQEL